MSERIPERYVVRIAGHDDSFLKDSAATLKRYGFDIDAVYKMTGVATTSSGGSFDGLEVIVDAKGRQSNEGVLPILREAFPTATSTHWTQVLPLSYFEEIDNKPIEYLAEKGGHLSPRVINHLHGKGIMLIGQLPYLTEEQVAAPMKAGGLGLGVDSLSQLRSSLANVGYSMKPS